MSVETADPTRIGRGEPPLDTTVRLVTPERVTFFYPLAGPFRRATAYLIDLFLCFIVFFIGCLICLFFEILAINFVGMLLILIFLLQWGYGATWEALANGQTLGKWMLGLRVVSSNGTPITGAQAFLRNLSWPVEGAVTAAFLPAIASMMFTSKFQRLGDLAAGTMVVVERRPSQGRLLPIKNPVVEKVLCLLPAKIDAGPDLARAVADYAARRERFSPSQREEMTGPLAVPVRKRYGIPDKYTNDVVVAALYGRVFLGR